MSDPFDLATYTDEYKQRLPPGRALELTSERWRRLLAAKPLLYLPDRSPIDDLDVRDVRRLLWTRQQLAAFSETVDQRTERVLLAQEAALRLWRDSAVHIQRLARGLLARRFVSRERDQLRQSAALCAWERAQTLGRLERQRAARRIQRSCRDYRERTRERERARRSLQQVARLFLFRCRRITACRIIQRAFRWWQWCRRLLSRAKALAQMRARSTKRQQLEEAAAVFKQAQRAAHERRQLQLWHDHGSKLQTLTRVRQRQRQMRALLADTSLLPPLGTKPGICDAARLRALGQETTLPPLPGRRGSPKRSRK